jgi:UDP-N-acetylglucosamine 4,6-dehydratase
VIPRWRSGKPVKITDPACTRFWMYRHEAVKLVLDCARNMRGGELYVPDLPAFTIGDLASAMGIRAYETIGLPAHEKMHESMDWEHSSERAPRLTVAQLKEMLTHV